MVVTEMLTVVWLAASTVVLTMVVVDTVSRAAILLVPGMRTEDETDGSDDMRMLEERMGLTLVLGNVWSDIGRSTATGMSMYPSCTFTFLNSCSGRLILILLINRKGGDTSGRYGQI